jgi:hypothetical protein
MSVEHPPRSPDTATTTIVLLNKALAHLFLAPLLTLAPLQRNVHLLVLSTITIVIPQRQAIPIWRFPPKPFVLRHARAKIPTMEIHFLNTHSTTFKNIGS